MVHASERPAPADMTSDHTTIAMEMNVVTGKAGILPPKKKGEQPEDHQTPMLVNLMRYLIFRPYWSVPIDITQREVLPGIAKDPDYLTEHNFEIVDRHKKTVEYTPKLDAKLLHGDLMVRQDAGDDNSLGLVKFMFPNPYSIYLHSTPAVGLFSRTRRDFSHGCVRVEKPLALAAWILRDRQEWTPDKIDEAMNTGDDNKAVGLKQTIPVTIFYTTAYVEPDGTVDFTHDIYGYDKLLDETLALGTAVSGETDCSSRGCARRAVMRMILRGQVVSGIGNFSYWIEKLQDHYLRKTGMRFYPGTLNVLLERPYSLPKQVIRLEASEYGGTVSVNMVPCAIGGRKAFLLRTDANEEGRGIIPRQSSRSRPMCGCAISSDCGMVMWWRLKLSRSFWLPLRTIFAHTNAS